MALDSRFLQSRYTQVGKVRMGLAPGSTDNNTKYPAKLDTFRFTSPGRHLIEAIAERYGGSPRPWRHPSRGNQFEVITRTVDIPVYVPRQNPDPWFELWGAKTTLQRRCDGVTERLRNRACLCDPEGVLPRDAPRPCKVTIRLSVMLADIPGIGVWGVESHGWNAVDEWTTYGPLVNALPPGQFWPGRMILEQRSSNAVTMRDGEEVREAREYYVPLIMFDRVTVQALASGAAALQALASGQAVQELGRAETAAIGSGPDRAALLAEISEATDRDAMMRIRDRINQAGLGDDQEVTGAWRTRAAQLVNGGPQRQVEAAPEQATSEQAEDTPGGEASTPAPASDDSEAARAQRFEKIMNLASGCGWKTSDVHTVIKRLAVVERSQDATSAQLDDIIADIEAGRVTP